MKINELLNEYSGPRVPKPAFANWMGDAEWDSLVSQQGPAGAEEYARTKDPKTQLAQTKSSVARNQIHQQGQMDTAKSQGMQQAYAQGQFTGQDRSAAVQANIRNKANTTATDNLLRVMDKANSKNPSRGLDSNELGQIGQMSSAWQPSAGNYRSRPGDVQLTGDKQQPQQGLGGAMSGMGAAPGSTGGPTPPPPPTGQMPPKNMGWATRVPPAALPGAKLGENDVGKTQDPVWNNYLDRKNQAQAQFQKQNSQAQQKYLDRMSKSNLGNKYPGQVTNLAVAKKKGFPDVGSYYQDIMTRLGSHDPKVYEPAQQEYNQYEQNHKHDNTNMNPEQYRAWLNQVHRVAGLKEAAPRKTKTATKPIDLNIPGPADSQPIAPRKTAQAPAIQRSTAADTRRSAARIRPNQQAQELLSRMRNIQAPQDDAGYPEDEPNTLPSTRVNTQNLPAVASSRLLAAGQENPNFHQVAALPGNMGQGIRTLGRQLFRSFTRTPTNDIWMVGNVMGQGPNSTEEVRAVANWVRNNGEQVQGGDIDFAGSIPGYTADIQQYSAGGIRWLLVRDQFGDYIYSWPESDSVTPAGPARLAEQKLFAQLCENIKLDEASTAIAAVHNNPGGPELLKALHKISASAHIPLGDDLVFHAVPKPSWSQFKSWRQGGWILVLGQRSTAVIVHRGGTTGDYIVNYTSPETGQVTSLSHGHAGDMLAQLKEVIGPFKAFLLAQETGAAQDKQKVRRERIPPVQGTHTEQSIFLKLKPLWLRTIESAINDIKGYVATMIKSGAYNKARNKIEKLEKLVATADAINAGEFPSNIKGCVNNAIILAAHYYYPELTPNIGYQQGYRGGKSIISYTHPRAMPGSTGYEEKSGPEQLLQDIFNGDSKKLSTVIGFFKREVLL